MFLRWTKRRKIHFVTENFTHSKAMLIAVIPFMAVGARPDLVLMNK